VAITRVFRNALGGFGRGRRNHVESDSEFFGEVEVFCELIKHPDRTWDPDEASLFIVSVVVWLMLEKGVEGL